MLKTTKYALLALSFALLMVSCGKTEKKAPQNQIARVKIADFAALDQSLLQKTIEVEGLVLHTCRHGGRKMFISDGTPDNKIKILATDKSGSFDKTLEGVKVLVTGKISEERIDEKFLNEWEQEVRAEQENEPKPEGATCKFEENKDMQTINKMRAELKSNGKGYVPRYSLECESYKKI